MNQWGYNRYMSDTRKTELQRLPVKIADPLGFEHQLNAQLARPYAWWGIIHNCQSFVTDPIFAGKSNVPFSIGVLKCPTFSVRSGPDAYFF